MLSVHINTPVKALGTGLERQTELRCNAILIFSHELVECEVDGRTHNRARFCWLADAFVHVDPSLSVGDNVDATVAGHVADYGKGAGIAVPRTGSTATAAKSSSGASW